MRFKRQYKKYFIWTPLFVLLIVALLFASYTIIKRQRIMSEGKSIVFGVTFSTKYAKDLGLDWKEVYDAIIDDLGVRYLRIPIYWDEVEPSPGNYDWEKFDYIIKRAEYSGAKIIAVVGRRQPRWPECHVPTWAYGNSETVQRVNILSVIESTINRYKNSPAIKVWQIDNEPLLRIFGECPEPDMNFLSREVELVRSLDETRPIMMTESGELSTWLRLTPLADWIGVSMYRVTWNDIWGYWVYPFTPNFYRRKAKIISPVTDKVIISELQAEPWFKVDVRIDSLEEQMRSMNPDVFRKNVRFAKETGLDETLLWGVEWWYWLKEVKGKQGMWEVAREVFDGGIQ